MESYKEFLNEASIEHISKDDKHAHIAIYNDKSYVTLSQTDFDDNKKISFVVSKSQIDELCKILQKMK
jgi:hypothetical protein